MKKLIKLYRGLVEEYKRLKKIIIEEDIRTEGKFSSALIALLCLLALGCFALAFLVLGKQVNMMDKEAKKLNWFDKLRLKAMMPNLKKYRRKYSDGLKPEDNYVLIKRTDYELMQKMVDRQDNYLAQIKMNNEEIGKLRDTNEDMVSMVKDTLKQLKLKEEARRKNASKIGALTTNYNKEKRKTEELLNTVNELEDTIKLQQLEIEKKDVQNKILKNTGKQKQLDDYKKLQELNQDIQKHKRK